MLQGEPLPAQFFDLMQGRDGSSHCQHTAHARVFDVGSTPSKRGTDADASVFSRAIGKNGAIADGDVTAKVARQGESGYGRKAQVFCQLA